MILRKTAQCRICSSKTRLRVVPGYAKKQKYTILCPDCKSELHFCFSYDYEQSISTCSPCCEFTDAHNILWPECDDATFTITLDPNHLIPSPVSKRTVFSPFLESMRLINNPEDLELRKTLAKSRFSSVSAYEKIFQLENHLEHSDGALFVQRAKELGFARQRFSDKARALLVFRAWENNTRPFRTQEGDARKKIRDRISEAENSYKTEFCQMIAHFNKDDRVTRRWRELQDIRKSWAQEVFPAISPFYTSRHLRDDITLDEWTLAQKEFRLLKDFFVECFETFCRVSVIAASVEGVLHGDVGVPKKSGFMTIEEFETIANGSKGDILKNSAVGSLFIPYIDARLRNGIGHHAAEYKASTDTITYTNQSKKRGIETFTISYIQFTKRLVDLYEQLETTSLYIAWIKARVAGISSKLV